MTWADLHLILRERGVVRAGDPVRAEASVGVVTGIAYDSRAVERGHVFVALKGLQRGRDRVRTPGDRPRRARDRVGGAGAARRPRALGHGGRRDGWRSPVLAAAFHGDPSRDMQVVGITGTNGKTTTAYLLASIFEAADIRCGIARHRRYRLGPGDQTCARRRGRRPKRPTSRSCCAKWSIAGSGRARWKCRRTRWSLRRVDDMQLRRRRCSPT